MYTNTHTHTHTHTYVNYMYMYIYIYVNYIYMYIRSSTRYHVVQDIKASHFSQERQRASLDFWQIEEMTTRGAITPVDEIWGPKMRAERKNGLCGCVPSVNEQWTQVLLCLLAFDVHKYTY
jgi:hypothetical protein